MNNNARDSFFVKMTSEYETLNSEELIENLNKKDSDLRQCRLWGCRAISSFALVVLAAQLGKQLLDKTTELQSQLDELDKQYSELKATHEHLNQQCASLTAVKTERANCLLINTCTGITKFRCSKIWFVW
jgi:cell division protein FtsB